MLCLETIAASTQGIFCTPKSWQPADTIRHFTDIAVTEKAQLQNADA